MQRSISYFKKLGIDDYDLIISIIKQELFFKEFIESEKEDKQSEFIRSEVDKAFEQMKIDREKAKLELTKAEEQAKLELFQAEQQRIKDLDEKKAKIDELKENAASASSVYEQEKLVLSGEVNKAKKEIKNIEYDKSNEQIKLKENLFKERENTISVLYKQKLPIEKQAEKSFNNYVFVFFTIVFAYFVGLAVITWRIGWEIMGAITYFLGLVGLFATYLYPAISGKDFNPRKYFAQKKEESINRKYSEFNFDIENFEKLINEKNVLKVELDEIKTAHNNKYRSFGG